MVTVFGPNLGIKVHTTKAHKLRQATANGAVSSPRALFYYEMREIDEGLRVLMFAQITTERAVHELGGAR